MRKATAFRNATILLVCSSICFLTTPCLAQKTQPSKKRIVTEKVASVSLIDGQELVNKIKELQIPATRAFFYSQVATWLWRSADNPELRRVANDAAITGIADIYEHRSHIPSATIAFFHSDLLRVVRQHNPDEAFRVEQKFPLQTTLTEERKASASLLSALAKDEKDFQSPSSNLNNAVQIINAGSVSATTLQAEIFRLDQIKSPALPNVLSATLSLEERRAGALPFVNLFFLSHVYLKDSTPLELQRRFLAVILNSTKARLEDLRSDSQALSWATQTLHRSIPFMQKVMPSLQPEAASLLASLAPNMSQQESAWTRIKNSSDPLAQTLKEADTAADPPLKRELLESAAKLAQQQGKLRLAIDLMTAEKEDRNGLPEGYSSRDDFLNKVIQDALKLKDADTANYAASKMTLPLYHVEGLRQIARHFVEAENLPSANDVLSKAVKSLQDAPEGKGKAVSYLRLSVDFIGVDDISASETARAAIKTANNIARPDKDEKGEFSQSLYQLMNETVRAFRVFARKDRTEAVGLSASLQPKDFKVAATLGIYSSSEK